MLLPGVLLQGGIDSLPELLHPVDVLQPLHVGVEEHDGSQTAQLRLVHRHLLHLRHQLDQHSAQKYFIAL